MEKVIKILSNNRNNRMSDIEENNLRISRKKSEIDALVEENLEWINQIKEIDIALEKLK